jgi:hypothetical protein
MKSRREFLKSVGTAGAALATGVPLAKSGAQTIAGAVARVGDRDYWLAIMKKIASPVLENLARRELKKTMPIEAANPNERGQYTHLEAFGRLLSGIAPWLEAQHLDESESRQQQRFIDLARESLDAATNPTSTDFMNFHDGSQPLVDAAFMAQGILRGRSVLWQGVDARIRSQVIEALKSSRQIATPTNNNWVMFAAMIETALHIMGEETIEERLSGCVRRMLAWYKGDGLYGDGEFLHFDYYNSFVIHPMLIDVLAVLREKDNKFEGVCTTELQRARRYAEIQERLIAPDGTFPSIGRSTTYRFGAFHALAQVALMCELPETVRPAQVRCAMTAVIRKTMQAPNTFDRHGWLRIGFCGHQPSLAENYISTGSLYLCSTAFLPLGLPPGDPFWSTPAVPWTSQRIWSGESLPPDHAISDARG